MLDYQKESFREIEKYRLLKTTNTIFFNKLFLLNKRFQWTNDFTERSFNDNTKEMDGKKKDNFGNEQIKSVFLNDWKKIAKWVVHNDKRKKWKKWNTLNFQQIFKKSYFPLI